MGNGSIKKIFIANRAEICRRIAETAKLLDKKTATLTDAAGPPAFLQGLVDEFIVREQLTAASYLDPEALILAAKESGCDAIHPGYGFLSENAIFAEKTVQAGLTWIGPRADTIDQLGDKTKAREIAESQQVPCVAALTGWSQKKSTDLSDAEAFAKKIGFPILVKAAFGGGGKGMRLADSIEELREAAPLASSEAERAFGNGSLIFEQFIDQPRHIEVQVIGDKHGNVIAVGDRDCSLQRRHQKIIEEAPAPNLPAKVREEMHAAACAVASAVRYDSVGTVELLYQDNKFYFLEMNTRLQVEHTVTEEVAQIDLVAEQIAIAEGQPLSDAARGVREPTRHSIEARIYAEDPSKGFFPASGPMHAFIPQQGLGVRWELGVDSLDHISSDFDPMIAKLICTAGNRELAMKSLHRILSESVICGPATNVPLMMAMLKMPEFIAGPLPTRYLDHSIDEVLPRIEADRSSAESKILSERSIAGQDGSGTNDADTLAKVRECFSGAQGTSKSESCDHWQRLTLRNSRLKGCLTTAERHAGGWLIKALRPDGIAEFDVVDGHTFARRTRDEALAQGRGDDAAAGDLRSPVPGKVVSIFANPGGKVEQGQRLFVLESMKMQYDVQAPKAGTLASVHVAVGDQVEAGVELAQWQE